MDRPVLAIFLTTALLVLVPSAHAEYAFGTPVAKADFDYTPYPKASKLGLCFIDHNGSGLWDSADDLYLDVSGDVDAGTSGDQFCSSGSIRVFPAVDDIRLRTRLTQFAPGSQVVQADADFGMISFSPAPDAAFSAGSLPHRIRYVDLDGDGALKSKDAIYIDLTFNGQSAGPDAKSVGAGDVRLNRVGQFAAGSTVAEGDPDRGHPLSDLGSGVGFESTNAVYKAGSNFYLNVDLQTLPTSTFLSALSGANPANNDANRWDFMVEEHDLRLNAKAPNPLAEKSAFLMNDVSAPLEVKPGLPFQVSGVIKNTGKWPGSGLVATEVDDVLVDSRGSPTLLPGETAKLVVTVLAPAEAGSFKVNMGGTSIFVKATGAVVPQVSEQVSAPAPSATASVGSDAASISKQGAPGGAVPLVAMALLAALVLTLRRTA